MPFADDVRNYAFASLDTLTNKKGEILTKHPYIPTEEQLEAMDNFVDAMDLMDAGDKDENGYIYACFNHRSLLTSTTANVPLGMTTDGRIIRLCTE
jgi:ATP-dependent DNA helicase 2 subunit 2